MVTKNRYKNLLNSCLLQIHKTNFVKLKFKTLKSASIIAYGFYFQKALNVLKPFFYKKKNERKCHVLKKSGIV